MRRESRVVWRERVARWRASGATAREFCEREALNVSTLRHWAWVFDRETRSSRAQPVEFVEVTANPPAHHDGFVVELRTGDRVCVPAHFERGELKKLLSLLVR